MGVGPHKGTTIGFRYDLEPVSSIERGIPRDDAEGGKRYGGEVSLSRTTASVFEKSGSESEPTEFGQNIKLLDITGFPIMHPINHPFKHVCQMLAQHTGGGNVLMGDGSVRFLRDSLPIATLASLATRDDGAPLSNLD